MNDRILPNYIKETKTGSAPSVTTDKASKPAPVKEKVHDLSSGLVFTAPMENNKD